MLIFKDSKYIKTPFKNEDELEQVVISNYEHIFGPTSIYLPKKLIKTGDGTGTIPDGFAIDLGSKKWSLVEAELLHHMYGVISHLKFQNRLLLASNHYLRK